MLDIILRIGNPRLQDIFRRRAQHPRLAPAEAGVDDERVESVVFGASAENRLERFLDVLFRRPDVDRAALSLFRGEVVNYAFGRAVARRDFISRFLHHAEAQMLKRRNDHRQLQRLAAPIEFDDDRALRIAGPAQDALRLHGAPHGFDDRDVVKRFARLDTFAIGGVERVFVALEEALRRRAVMRGAQRVEKPVRPVAGDEADAPRQFGDRRAFGRAGLQADDVMHAHERGVAEMRAEGGDMAVIGAGDRRADFLAYSR